VGCEARRGSGLATLFAVGAGIWAVRNTALDAISDLSDTQVIDGTDLY
jgi:Cu(I)/Ag(I) efflux system membrane protein CusA/SilA